LKIKKKQQNIKERMRKKISTLARCTAAFSNKLYALMKKKTLCFKKKKTNVGIISSGLDKKSTAGVFFSYMKIFTNELGILFHRDKNLL